MFQRGAHLFAQLFEGFGIGEPIEQFGRKIEGSLDALEIMRKDLVEGVEIALTLHETGAGDMVEALDL